MNNSELDIALLIDSIPEAMLSNHLELYLKNGEFSNQSKFYEPWPVEDLLNQAADILDRCLTTKREIEKNWISAAQLYLEFQSDRVAAISEESQTNDLQYAIDALRKRDTFQTQATPKQYYGENKDLADLKIEAILLNKISNGYAAASGGGLEAARNAEARNSATIELMHFLEERNTTRQLLSEAVMRKDEHDTYVTEITNVRAEKKSLADGGPFDYISRIKALIEFQLVPDLKDALERCFSAEKGLNAIFDWKKYNIASPIPATPKTTLVEELWAWTNGAIRWLLKETQRDQQFTVQLSLGKVDANKIINFNTPAELFLPYKQVRMRGVSCFVETENTQQISIYSALIKPPEVGCYFDGTPVHQARDSFVLGRVTTGTHKRNPEVGGTVSALNASPIGANGSSWELTLTPKNSTAMESKVLDLIVELLVVGRAFES